MSYTLENGWIVQARCVPSANCGARPCGAEIALLVIHSISLPPGQYGGDFIEHFFTNALDTDAHEYFLEIAGLEVSSHLLIRRTGELLQFVSMEDRAWHAGKSCFEGRRDCNDFSIGIEMEGTDDDPYSDIQYEVLGDVTAMLLEEFPQLNVDTIVGHCDIAPGRKTDPGPSFDWHRYRISLADTGDRT